MSRCYCAPNALHVQLYFLPYENKGKNVFRGGLGVTGLLGCDTTFLADSLFHAAPRLFSWLLSIAALGPGYDACRPMIGLGFPLVRPFAVAAVAVQASRCPNCAGRLGPLGLYSSFARSVGIVRVRRCKAASLLDSLTARNLFRNPQRCSRVSQIAVTCTCYI